MKLNIGHEKKPSLRFAGILAAILILFFIGSLFGCTIRTSKGDEIELLKEFKEKGKDKNKDVNKDMTGETGTTPPGNDFTDLPLDEQNDLASGRNNSNDKIDPGDPLTPGNPNGDNRSTRISGGPQGVLPKQIIMYPVPGAAENILFDRERHHRSNRKAAIELTHQGVTALDSGKVDLAITKFQKAISVDSKFGHAYFYFARARFAQKDWDQVIALTDKAILLLTGDKVFQSRAHLLQAQAYSNRKLYIQALSACEKAINIDSSNVPAKLLKTRLQKLFR